MSSPSDLQTKVSKLYTLSIYGRWLMVIFSWLTLGSYAIWNLRAEIYLCWDYCTIASVYYGLHFNFFPTLCLAFCLTITLLVLCRQSHDLIWGLSKIEQRKLEKQVKKILAQGDKHPLWKWINS